MGRSRTATRAAGFSVVVAAALVATALLGAPALDQAARDAGRRTRARVGYAQAAVVLAPWAERHRVTLAVAEARTLLDAGEVDGAYELLLPLSTTVRGDLLLTETYQEAVARKTVIDSRKAHVQHAREGKDGSLDPEDVER